MKRISAIILVLMGLAGILHAAVTWDGGAGNSAWSSANNWNPNGVPTSTDDVVIDSSAPATIFLGAANQYANSLTIDRSAATLTANVSGGGYCDLQIGSQMTVTSTHTDSSNPLIKGGGSVFVFRLQETSFTLDNNSSGEVRFQKATIRGESAISQNFYLTGSGTTVFGTSVTVANTVNALILDSTYSGTLRLDADVGSINPLSNIQIRGGLLDVNANNRIGDGVELSFNDAISGSATANFAGVTDDIGILSSYGAGGGGTILVDGLTSLVFDNLVIGNGQLDFTGWVEGETLVKFSSYTGSTGVVSGVTINGAAAVMLDNGDTTYQLSMIPEPSTLGLFVVSTVGVLVAVTGLREGRR